MNYQYLFGPVPSRRLGISLGIDMVPHKVCSLNCVYCECGPTTRLTTERREYVPGDRVKKELDHYLCNNPAPDYITFSGSGEPTLNSRTGDIIDHIKRYHSAVPVAVLTNGTLFADPRVRRELMKADLVLPSLDAVTRDAFLRLNRPHHRLTVEEHLRGLREFAEEYKGEIWLEVFILPGYNDDPAHLRKMKEILRRLRPGRIQINTLDRPGAVRGLVPATPAFLREFAEDPELPQAEVIAAVSRRREQASYRKDTESAILGTLSRRPCTLQDLSRILGLHINEINKYLDTLEADGRIGVEEMRRGKFYRCVKKNCT